MAEMSTPEREELSAEFQASVSRDGTVIAGIDKDDLQAILDQMDTSFDTFWATLDAALPAAAAGLSIAIKVRMAEATFIKRRATSAQG